jgi:hypothetical protein
VGKEGALYPPAATATPAAERDARHAMAWPQAALASGTQRSGAAVSPGMPQG